MLYVVTHKVGTRTYAESIHTVIKNCQYKTINLYVVYTGMIIAPCTAVGLSYYVMMYVQCICMLCLLMREHQLRPEGIKNYGYV